MEDNKLLDKIEKKIIQILKKEGGAAGLAPLKKATDKMDQPKDFDLKKTLKKMDKVEKHKESDYILTPINEKDDVDEGSQDSGPFRGTVAGKPKKIKTKADTYAGDAAKEGKDNAAMKKSALGMAMYGKKAKMKESELRGMIRETIFETITEELCAKGKAYIAKRKRAGEKSSAYLSGRAVKVCKGQMKG